MARYLLCLVEFSREEVVLNQMQHKVDAKDFRNLFVLAPELYLVLLSDGPKFTIVAASDAYTHQIKIKREEILGKGIFDIFPNNINDPMTSWIRDLRSSLNRVVEFRAADFMAMHEYDIYRPELEGGGIEKRYWSPENSPVLDSEGRVVYIIHRVEDVTQIAGLKQRNTKPEGPKEELRPISDKMESEILSQARKIQEANQKLRESYEEFAKKERALAALNVHDELQTQLLKRKLQEYLIQPFIPQELRARVGDLLVARTAEAKYQGLLESAQDAIIIVGATANIEFINDQVIKWFGYTQQELIGQPIEILVPERYRCAHLQQRNEYLIHPRKRLMAKNKNGLDLIGLRKDGSEFPVDIALSPLETPEEKLVIAIIRDMTDRDRLETQVKFLATACTMLADSLEFEDSLKNITSYTVPEIADGCIIQLFDDDRKLQVRSVVHRNQEKQQILEKLIKSFAAKGIWPVDLSKPIMTSKMLLMTEFSNLDFNKLAIDLDDQRLIKQLEISAYVAIPLLIHNRLIGILSFISDESKRRFEESDSDFFESIGLRVALTIENARLYDERQRAIKLREEILAIVSHDLKNPLTAIQLNTQSLTRNQTNDSFNLSSFAEKIRRSADQMKRMIEDLLDFSKIQSGKLSIQKHIEKPYAVIEIAFEMMKAQAEEKGLKFTFSASPELPDILCDKERIVQALANLVGNAIKFTDKGGRIHMSVEESQSDVRFSVTDTGIGISKENLPKIFNRYWQAQRSKGEGGSPGAGLGLSITNGIIEAHDGKIWVESQLGNGSTFYFQLPIFKK